MRTIIKNRLYDTETAKPVGRYTPMDEEGSSFTETLYRKKNGEYFLCRVFLDKTEEVIPLSYDAAKTWGEMSLCDLDYNRAFSEATQSTVVKVDISAKARKLLEIEQSKSGKTYNEIIDGLIVSNLG